MAVVQADALVKRFGTTEALRGLTLSVEGGTVLGVLGPNGAGKTTAVRILTTLLKPDGGRAVIDGVDVTRDPGKVRARIGLTGQYAAVDERLTGRENLELVGRFFHMSGGVARHRAGELLDDFALTDAGDRIVKGYSGGMRRRLDIAMSLVARPRVLFLDEPTTGLDPRSRLGMWDLIESLVAQGTTTLLTTQYLEEADRLAHNIAVIDHGSVIAEGTADQLKTQLGGDRVVVTLHHDGGSTTSDEAAAVVSALAPFAAPTATPAREGRQLTLNLRSGVTTPDVVRALDARGATVVDLSIERPTLDDVFLSLTGHRAEEEGDAEGDAAFAKSRGKGAAKTATGKDAH
ncbi:MAG: ATP-binding cassette domain-containing protein [Acidimicrobiia bacterium]